MISRRKFFSNAAVAAGAAALGAATRSVKEQSRSDNRPKILRKSMTTLNLTSRTILLVNRAKTVPLHLLRFAAPRS
jgi:hypothetical protein